MDQQEKKTLEETLALTEKNHQILKSMYRSMRWARASRIVYWLIVIGVTVGAYYYVQPYIDQFLKIGASLKDNADTISKIFNSIPR